MKPLRELIKEPFDALDRLIVGWNLEEIKRACKRKNSYDRGFMAGVRSDRKKYENLLKSFDRRIRILEIKFNYLEK